MDWQLAIETFLRDMHRRDRSDGTLNTYKKHLTDFFYWLERQHNGPIDISEVSALDVEKYLGEMKISRHLKPSTRSLKHHALSSFFKFAGKQHWVERGLMEEVDPIKVPYAERFALRPEQIDELIAKIDSPIIQFAVIFMFKTGLRVSEAVKITVDQVDLVEKTVLVVRGKGGDDRIVYMSSDLVKQVREYLESVRPKHVLTNRLLATSRTGKISANYINDVLRKARTTLGWDQSVSAHIMRHSFGTELVRKKVQIAYVSKLMGHKNITTTMRYMHADEEDLKKAVMKLD